MSPRVREIELEFLVWYRLGSRSLRWRLIPYSTGNLDRQNDQSRGPEPGCSLLAENSDAAPVTKLSSRQPKLGSVCVVSAQLSALKRQPRIFSDSAGWSWTLTFLLSHTPRGVAVGTPNPTEICSISEGNVQSTPVNYLRGRDKLALCRSHLEFGSAQSGNGFSVICAPTVGWVSSKFKIGLPFNFNC